MSNSTAHPPQGQQQARPVHWSAGPSIRPAKDGLESACGSNVWCTWRSGVQKTRYKLQAVTSTDAGARDREVDQLDRRAFAGVRAKAVRAGAGACRARGKQDRPAGQVEERQSADPAVAGAARGARGAEIEAAAREERSGALARHEHADATRPSRGRGPHHRESPVPRAPAIENGPRRAAEAQPRRASTAHVGQNLQHGRRKGRTDTRALERAPATPYRVEMDRPRC